MNNEDAYEINLYRISDEALLEINKALRFYMTVPGRNVTALTVANLALMKPYTTVKNGQTPVIPVTPENLTLKDVKTENILNSFSQFLDKAIEKSGTGDCNRLINQIKNTYTTEVLGNLINE